MKLVLKKIEAQVVEASVNLISVQKQNTSKNLSLAHIEIVSSKVPGLSSMNNVSRLVARETLSRHVRKVGITIVDSIEDLDRLIASRPDLVFLGMDFLPMNPSLGVNDPDKIWIADYLTRHGIAHTGSDGKAHKLENNKSLAKQIILEAGLNTAKYVVATSADHLDNAEIDLDYPLFVKPLDRGGGSGIDSESLVLNFKELRSKVDKLNLQLKTYSIIEEYLPGREFSVAILKRLDIETYDIMPIELLPPMDQNGVRMLSKNVKSADLEVASIVMNPILHKAISNLAINVFGALGVQDYGRIDIRLDKDGLPHFLEANLIPSLIENYGSFPKACLLNLGMSYEDMMIRIASLGMHKREVARKESFDNESISKVSFQLST